MHPAPSIIFFTVLSGSGYGLLFLLAALGGAGHLPEASGFGLLGMALSLALITAGLLSSTFHLGHPERAWRAFSQWRSSWLSREGVASVLTYLPAVFLAYGWVIRGEIWLLPALLSAVGAAVTVACTAMIYASLKPVAQWHGLWTLPSFVGLSLAAGALLLAFLSSLFMPATTWPLGLATLLLALGWSVKAGYWLVSFRKTSAATPESATGLGNFGKVRLLEAPHSEENYLMKEMAFSVGRRHAAKLRRIAVLLGITLPIALLLLSQTVAILPAAIPVGAAALSGVAGILVERWLFFAEAKHTVTLYYGAGSA